jgi:hypothetical protein
MKNYAYRSGLYLGIIESLKNTTSIYKLLNCDDKKMKAFEAIIKWKLERANQEAEGIED